MMRQQPPYFPLRQCIFDHYNTMGTLFSRNFNPATDLADMKGKVVIVTGGNTGIGFATIQHLSRAGAKVYMAARNESKALAAIEQLKKEGLGDGKGGGEVVWMRLDLSDPREAKKSAEDFLEKENRLDVLINNAGMLKAPYEIGKDGVSTLVTVNYISPFVFTRTLLPLLEKTAQEPESDVRIVNLTSIAHKLTPSTVAFKEVSDFNVTFKGNLLPGFSRYAHSKFLDLIWTRTLAAHFASTTPPTRITPIAVHPGGVDTFNFTASSSVLRFLTRLVIAGPEMGAWNSVFAAAGKRVAEDRGKYAGAYLESQPTGRIANAGKAVEQADGEVLWGTTERFLESIGL